VLLFLLVAGDVESNPGPYRPPQPYLLYAMKRRQQCRFESLAHAAHCNKAFIGDFADSMHSPLALLLTFLFLYVGYVSPPAKWRHRATAIYVIQWLWQIQPSCVCGDEWLDPFLYFEAFVFIHALWIWNTHGSTRTSQPRLCLTAEMLKPTLARCPRSSSPRHRIGDQ